MDILQKLKTQTKHEHDELEQKLDLLRDDLTLDQYIGLLKKFYGFYKPLEEQFLWNPAHAKVPKLEEDLNSFKFSSFELIPLAKIPTFSSLSEQMGVFYVVEGSTLGGMILSKHFSQKFKLSHGLSFFSGYGDQTMKVWGETRERISTFSQSKECDEAVVIESAKYTFQILSRWLNS